jgi:hypothetical protein
VCAKGYRGRHQDSAPTHFACESYSKFRNFSLTPLCSLKEFAEEREKNTPRGRKIMQKILNQNARQQKKENYVNQTNKELK